MTTTEADWALETLGLTADSAVALAGSRSGAGVFSVTLGSETAVLKVARAAPGQLGAAERELNVYLHLAPSLPVKTPRLLDHARTDDAVILLLAAAGGTEAAVSWDLASWRRLARELARLHEVPPPDDPSWPRTSWILDSLSHPDLGLVERFWSRRGEIALLQPVLGDLPALAAAISRPTSVLVHGDCHTDNLLRSDDEIIWIDWQAVGVGSPATDLAFLSVRGVPDGAVIPGEAMLAEYATRRGLDVGPLRTAVLAAELATFVLAWPHYAAVSTPAQIAQVRARVRVLARAWSRHRAG